MSHILPTTRSIPSPDALVITDLGMPEVDGRTVAANPPKLSSLRTAIAKLRRVAATT
jgi:CheY-like chemotaxis protein